MIYFFIILISAFHQLNYDEIYEKLTEFSNFPFLNLTTTQKLFNLPNLQHCNGCKTPLLTISNGPPNVPQIYFSGCLHGDERLGPPVLVYLTEYLTNEYHTDPFIKRLVDTRKIILTPMTNAEGYYNHRREEKVENKLTDPNRDFGYMTNSNCMNTITARSVYKVFEHFLIRGSVTFHGGVASITYPWGAPNHLQNRKSTEAPDFKASDELAKNLLRISEANLEYGSMNEIVYEVTGGMEDWAYSAGWENEYNSDFPVNNCSSSNYEEIHYEYWKPEWLKQMIFLVEMDYNKNPPSSEYGKYEEIYKGGGGLVPEFVRMALAYIDMMEPTVIPEVYPWKKGVVIEWEVWGCLKVDYTLVYYKNYSEYFIEELEAGNYTVLEEFEKSEKEKGSCRWGERESVFREWIETDEKIILVVEAEVDEDWKEEENPDPPVSPETHLVRARTVEMYNVSYNGYSIIGNNRFFSREIVIEGKFDKCVLYDLKGQKVAELVFVERGDELIIQEKKEIDGGNEYIIEENGDLSFKRIHERDIEMYLCELESQDEILEQKEEIECKSRGLDIKGQKIMMYNDFDLVASGVVESAYTLSISDKRGICVIFSYGEIHTQFLFEINHDYIIYVEGFTKEKIHELTIKVNELTFPIQGEDNEDFTNFKSQSTPLMLYLIGERIFLPDLQSSCVIGLAEEDSEIQYPISAKNSNFKNIWIYVIISMLMMGVLYIILLYYGRKSENRRLNPQILSNIEESS